jgi:hypothetical protein
MGQGFQQRVASALQLPLKQTKLVAGPVPAVPSQARYYASTDLSYSHACTERLPFIPHVIPSAWVANRSSFGGDA